MEIAGIYGAAYFGQRVGNWRRSSSGSVSFDRPFDCATGPDRLILIIRLFTTIRDPRGGVALFVHRHMTLNAWKQEHRGGLVYHKDSIGESRGVSEVN